MSYEANEGVDQIDEKEQFTDTTAGASEGDDDGGSEDGIGGAAPAAAPAIEPFALVKKRMTLVNLNLRSENHGEESVPACDIKLSLKTSNAVLKKLRPGLLEDFYTYDRQGDVDGEFRRKLKHPQMGPVSWDFELPRALLRFHDIDSVENDVVLGGGKANKFKLTMMDGGTVQVDFRVQFSEPDDDAIAPLMRVLKQTIQVSLSSEALEEKPDNFQQADLLSVANKPKSAALLEAEALFSGGGDAPGDDLPFGAAPAGDTDQVEQQNNAGIAEAESEVETPSNVAPIRKRQKRTAAGAE